MSFQTIAQMTASTLRLCAAPFVTSQKLLIDYVDESDRQSQRSIWPFMIAYWDHVRLICAWCELRNDFRHFRTDRVTQAVDLGERFPERIATLRHNWQKQREADRESRSNPG